MMKTPMIPARLTVFVSVVCRVGFVLGLLSRGWVLLPRALLVVFFMVVPGDFPPYKMQAASMTHAA